MVNKALSKEMIEKAAQEAVQAGVLEAVKALRERIKLKETVDRIIEIAIPKRYSGPARARIKDRIRENLRKEYKIF